MSTSVQSHHSLARMVWHMFQSLLVLTVVTADGLPGRSRHALQGRADTLLQHHQQQQQVRPMPRWEWNVSTGLPVGWFGSNTSGYENAAQLDAISRYDLAIFGWQAFLQATNYTREAEHLVLQARRVKAKDPSMPVAIYLDAELAEPFQDAVLKAMRDPSLADFFLRDRNGSPIPCNVFCRSMPAISKTDPRCLAYYWNWFNSSAIDYYLEHYIEPIVALDGFDAVFFDGADEWMMQRSHTWAVASNVGQNVTLQRGLEVMMDVRVRTTQLLHKYHKYPIISEHLGDTAGSERDYIATRMQGLGYFRYFEFFAPQVQYIELMLNETQRAPAGTELPIMCRQLIHRGLSLTDSIAAFLVAMGNYSYYSASTGWFDADWSWHTEYQFKYGLPLGKAAKTGSVYTRSFTGCDVTVNCTGVGRSNCKGTIEMKEHSH